MLPKINRLKNKKDFDLVFKEGRSFKENSLVLRAAANGLETSRFGFIVSLKVSKKAAVRNKIRRRLSEIIRAEGGNIKKGIDAAVLALPGTEKKEFSELEPALKSLLVKAKIINV